MSAPRRFAGGAAWVAALALAAGCLGTSPKVNHYVMSPVPASAVGAGSTDLAVGLLRVAFPRYLERPQLVTRANGSQLRVDEVNRWAGGFETNVIRTLATDLGMRLGTDRVVVDPSAFPFATAFDVSVGFDQFEAVAPDQLLLRARWMIRENGPKPRLWTETSTIRQPINGTDIPSLVAAHDAALGALADAIATKIATAR